MLGQYPKTFLFTVITVIPQVLSLGTFNRLKGEVLISDKQLSDAIATTVAKQILETITQEHRDAMLMKSITEALKSWQVNHKIEDIVAKRAGEVAEELLQDNLWGDRIIAAVQDGFDLYIQVLPQAVKESLVEAFHGKERSGSYGDAREGLVLKHLRVEQLTKKLPKST